MTVQCPHCHSTALLALIDKTRSALLMTIAADREAAHRWWAASIFIFGIPFTILRILYWMLTVPERIRWARQRPLEEARCTVRYSCQACGLTWYPE